MLTLEVEVGQLDSELLPECVVLTSVYLPLGEVPHPLTKGLHIHEQLLTKAIHLYAETISCLLELGLDLCLVSQVLQFLDSVFQ